MEASEAPRQISDLAARAEIYDAMDTYGLTSAEDIANHLDLPLEQVRRVQLLLETELPLDDLDEEL